jgi:hypothetical protein
MSRVRLVPIKHLIHDVTRDLHVVVTADEHGFRETALEACLLAKEKLQAIREALLRPDPGAANPRYDTTASIKPQL